MIAIFLIAGFFSCLIVITCFMSQTDRCIVKISHRHAICLYSLIIAAWGIPEALLILGNWIIAPHTGITFRDWAVLIQFVLLSAIYARYRLIGVLALHFTGILIYLIFIGMCIMSNYANSYKTPAFNEDQILSLWLAAAFGSLASMIYSIVHIFVRRRKKGQAFDKESTSAQ
jgi:hypothetical protein